MAEVVFVAVMGVVCGWRGQEPAPRSGPVFVSEPVVPTVSRR